MDTILFFSLTIMYLILLFIGINLARKYSWHWSSNVLLIVIIGLIYDNGVLAVGSYIGKGSLLESLNLARYWLHAFLTPLLVIFSWRLISTTGIHWGKKSMIKYGAMLLTLSLVMVEIIMVVWGISLHAEWQYGVLSYENTETGNGPPIMIIGVSIVLLLTSLLIWWKQKWIWLFIAISVMVVASLIKIPIKTNTLHNVSELILVISLLATKANQDRKI